MNRSEPLKPTQLIGAMVRLRRGLTCVGGQRYRKGSHWIVYQTWRAMYSLKRVGPEKLGGGHEVHRLRGVKIADFEIIETKEQQ